MGVVIRVPPLAADLDAAQHRIRDLEAERDALRMAVADWVQSVCRIQAWANETGKPADRNNPRMELERYRHDMRVHDAAFERLMQIERATEGDILARHAAEQAVIAAARDLLA